MNGVDFTDYQSIHDYSLQDVDINSVNSLHYDMFCAAVGDFSNDLNQFDKTKHACAACGDTCLTFNTGPELKCTDI